MGLDLIFGEVDKFPSTSVAGQIVPLTALQILSELCLYRVFDHFQNYWCAWEEA